MKKTEKRWFDEEDFTTEHDEIFLRLLTDWNIWVTSIFKKLTDHKWEIKGKIDGEPCLHGYPPVFPDAIINGELIGDHKNIDLKAKFVEIYNDGLGVELKCPYEYCSREEYESFNFPKQEVWWEENFKDEYDECQQFYNEDCTEYWRIKEDRLNELEEKYENEKAVAKQKWIKKMKHQSWKNDCEGKKIKIVLEIKPKIKSFGSVLRQMKLYKSRVSSFRGILILIIITNDSRYDAAFLSQDINVFHPNGDPSV